MGVDYRAAMIYGLPSKDVPELLDDSEGDYKFYDLGLEQVSPYYDSDSEDWVIGISIAQSGDYCSSEVNIAELPEKLNEAKKKFLEVTGKEGKLYISTHGY